MRNRIQRCRFVFRLWSTLEDPLLRTAGDESGESIDGLSTKQSLSETWKYDRPFTCGLWDDLGELQFRVFFGRRARCDGVDG